MAKSAQRILFLTLCVLALPCVEPAHAGTTAPTAANKVRTATAASNIGVAKTSAPGPVSTTPAVSPQMELARKYSPIQYCQGTSYPAATWMQVRDFREKYSPLVSPASSQARPVATDPKLATIPKLEYPLSIQPSTLDGTVSVMVAVTKDGAALDALVLCSNHPAFSDAALMAVKAATFVPATRDGKPVESVATLPIDFHH